MQKPKGNGQARSSTNRVMLFLRGRSLAENFAKDVLLKGKPLGRITSDHQRTSWPMFKAQHRDGITNQLGVGPNHSQIQIGW